MWTARERDQYMAGTAAFLMARHGLSEREAWRLLQKSGLPALLRKRPEETGRLSPKARAENIINNYK